MAHVDDGKGSKSANVELNIVPVIDLMSVLIVFLLITAVWNQISMIQLGTSVYGKKTNDEPVKELPKKLEVPLRLDILKGGYRLVIGSNATLIPKLEGEYDKDKLGEELAKVKLRYPEKEDIFLSVDDELEYDSMVSGMDVAIAEGFPSIAVTTGSSKDAEI